MAVGAEIYEFARSGAHFGTLENPTHGGVAGSEGDGPWMRLQLRVVDSRVEEARYETHGCIVARACGEVFCGLAEGMNPALLSDVGPRIRESLSPFPEGKAHCVELVLECVRQAISKEIQ